MRASRVTHRSRWYTAKRNGLSVSKGKPSLAVEMIPAITMSSEVLRVLGSTVFGLDARCSSVVELYSVNRSPGGTSFLVVDLLVGNSLKNRHLLVAGA